MRQFQSTISSAGMPLLWPVLRPRCWSGKKRILSPIGVAGGADDAAVFADEAFEAGGAVHIGDGHDRAARALERFLDRVPGGVDIVGVGHVGHRAAGGHVREDDPHVLRRQDVGGFGHEVDAAEDDVFGALLGGGVLRELEAVPGEVGVLDDLFALIVVAEDDELFAQVGAGGGDATVELFRFEVKIGPRDVLLPGDEGGFIDEGDRLE
jgi:hypothetical protein